MNGMSSKIELLYEARSSGAEFIRTSVDHRHPIDPTSQLSRKHLKAEGYEFDPESNAYFDQAGNLIRPSVLDQLLLSKRESSLTSTSKEILDGCSY